MCCIVIAIAGLRKHSAWNLTGKGNSEIIPIFVRESPNGIPNRISGFDEIIAAGTTLHQAGMGAFSISGMK